MSRRTMAVEHVRSILSAQFMIHANTDKFKKLYSDFMEYFNKHNKLRLAITQLQIDHLTNNLAEENIKLNNELLLEKVISERDYIFMPKSNRILYEINELKKTIGILKRECILLEITETETDIR